MSSSIFIMLSRITMTRHNSRRIIHKLLPGNCKFFIIEFVISVILYKIPICIHIDCVITQHSNNICQSFHNFKLQRIHMN